MSLPRFETPPCTEEEWAEALKYYGRDRDDDICRSSESVDEYTLTPCASSRPGPLYEILNLGSDGTGIRSQGEWSNLIDSHARRPTPSPESVSDKDRGSLATNTLIPKSLRGVYDQQDGRSGTEERRRLRTHYEEYGWLPAPRPGRSLRNKRRKAVQYLGLSGCPDGWESSDLRRERLEIISTYARVVKDTFKSKDALVVIFRDNDALYVGANRGVPPMITSLENVAGSHFTVTGENRCFVCPDMTRDWRFAKNPHARRLGSKFVAVAPLRLHKDNTTVDVGCFGFFDDVAHSAFDFDKQSILLNLAGLLIRQLSTLQSDHMERRSTFMYETCTSFLRRGVAKKAAPLEKVSWESPTIKETRSPKALEPTLKAESRRPFMARMPSTPSPAFTMMEAKTCPRQDSAASEMEQSLLRDYAETLRSMLDAKEVALVMLDDFEIFVKPRIGHDSVGQMPEIEHIISAFTLGDPCPPQYEPIVHHDQKTTHKSLSVISTPVATSFRFEGPDTHDCIAGFLKTHLQTRQFWLDREDAEDDLAVAVMRMMPEDCMTALGTVHFTGTGKAKFVAFVAWSRPSLDFGESSVLLVPFMWVLGGCLRSVLAILQVAQAEESRYLCGNLQAHELRTPLHQILAITRMLRTTITDMGAFPASDQSPLAEEKMNELFPLLDAIDDSSQGLGGIIDNILSFLELKTMEHGRIARSCPNISNIQEGVQQPLVTMLEDQVVEAWEENRRYRRAKGFSEGTAEAILDIQAPDIAAEMMEDSNKSLRQVVAKLLSNAFKFSEQRGVVEIEVRCDQATDVPSTFQYVAYSRKVNIIIRDNGIGMDTAFVRDKLGEPWTKEDQFAPGSGLGIYVAFRLVQLLDGEMEIRSARGMGCEVQVTLPLPKIPKGRPHIPRPSLVVARRCALAGFHKDTALEKLGRAIRAQLVNLGCDIVALASAELVIADGSLEHEVEKISKMKPGAVIVFLVSEDEPHLSPVTAAWEKNLDMSVRRLRKPVTPRLLREALQSSGHAPVRVMVQDDNLPGLHSHRPSERTMEESDSHERYSLPDTPVFPSLGDLSLEPPVWSPGLSSTSCSSSTAFSLQSPMTSPSAYGDASFVGATSARRTVKVLVVEDNVVNRKILVKILELKASTEGMIGLRLYDVVEVADGLEALRQFETFDEPCLVLLDINMPRLDGFRTSSKMRALEAAHPSRGKSEIIAVTALSSLADKTRGTVESGMDAWVTKPFKRATLNKLIDQAVHSIQDRSTALQLGGQTKWREALIDGKSQCYTTVF